MMISDFIKKEDCRSCRFCCVFRRKSLWEVPKHQKYIKDKYPAGFDGKPVRYKEFDTPSGSWVITDLSDKYKTDDPEEEAPCPFLDPDRGCALPDEDKPFECKAWPLRYMRMEDNSLKVTLTPTCPAPGLKDTAALKKKSSQSWEKAFEEYAAQNPYIINEYRDGYIIL